MHELRIAEGKLARQLDSGETLKLSHEPGVDFDKLSDSDISEIAKETNLDESDIKRFLAYKKGTDKTPEFDGFVIEKDGKAVYYEAKSGSVRKQDAHKKLTFLKAYEKRNPNLDGSQLQLYSALGESDDRVRSSAWKYLENNKFADPDKFEWSASS